MWFSFSGIALIMLHFQFINHPIVSFIPLRQLFFKSREIYSPKMDKQEVPVTLLVLLDLSASFYTVDHKILINILESGFEICGDVLKWLRSYLTGRVQHAIVDQQSSKTFSLNHSVPQGSCLGPVLFYCRHQDCLRLLRSTFHQFMDTLMITVLSCMCRFVQIRLLLKIKQSRLLRTA